MSAKHHSLSFNLQPVCLQHDIHRIDIEDLQREIKNNKDCPGY